jgi:ubiquinone/menaquinone biosynthesis C-methylase UbiE
VPREEETHLEILKEKLGSISGGRILDVATGDGNFVNLLVNNMKDYSEITGIDCDKTIIELSRKTFNNDKISFEYMSGEDIKYEDCSFDTVSISNSLHHLVTFERTLNEMLRVLKPGGVFIINELFCDGQNEKQLSHVYLHHLQAEVDTILGICHNKTLKKQEIIDIAGSIGLSKLQLLIHENEMFNKYVHIGKFAERYRILVDSIKGYPQYDKYYKDLEKLIKRLDEVGVEFASQLMILGNKP